MRGKEPRTEPRGTALKMYQCIRHPGACFITSGPILLGPAIAMVTTGKYTLSAPLVSSLLNL